MRNSGWRDFWVRALSGFSSLALAILLYFFMLRLGDIVNALKWFLGILTPFLMGGLIAYLLKSPCNFFKRFYEKHLPKKLKKRADGLAITTIVVLTIAVLYLLLALMLPQLVDSVTLIVRAAPDAFDAVSDWLMKFTAGNPDVQTYLNKVLNGIGSGVTAWLEKDLLANLQMVLGSFANTASSVLTGLYQFFISLVVCVYLLAERKHLSRNSKTVLYAVIPSRTADKILRELALVDRTFSGFFEGKIVDSAIIGAICYMFCLIMSCFTHFPNGVLISVIIGVTNIIPYFGPLIGAIPATLLVLTTGPVNCLIFLAFILILQQFDGNFLGPKLLSGSVGLSGFWVLFSITVFGGMFGFIGILLGVPVFAVIYDIVRRLTIRGLRRRGRTDLIQPEND